MSKKICWYIRHVGDEDYIFITAKVANPMEPAKAEKLEFLVDTGASGCAIPESVAEKLGLEHKGYVDAGLADGSVKRVKATYVLLEVAGKRLYTWTIFGEGFQPLLGVDVMRVLGVHLDVPEKKMLVPFRHFKVKNVFLTTGMRLHVFDVLGIRR